MPATMPATVRTIVLAVIVLLCAAPMTAPAVAAPHSAALRSSGTARTAVLADCVHPRVRPHTVIIACGDGTWYLRIRHYRYWQRDSALGRGAVWVNDCTPDCARGHVHRFAAVIRFVRPVRTGHVRVFSVARVRYLANGHHQRIALQTRALGR